MDSEAKIVALGGLLHDIGKFEQRKSAERKRHPEYGYDFLKKYSEYVVLPLFARYHHFKDLESYRGDVRTKNLLYIVYEADNISSGERKKIEEEADMKSFDPANPLACIFSSVNLGKGDSEKMYYPLSDFTPHTYFFPKKYHRNTVSDYQKLFERFEREFEMVARNGFDLNLTMSVLEKYTTFISAMVTEDNDISLYDHLKTTSAIALCMYYYHRNELDKDISHRITDRSEKKYLIIGGDISGIQDFIYTITSKGALKYLRARSLFLELLTEDVVEAILERLGLTRANVIFAGGGRFYILAHNTDRAKDEIKKLSEEANRWLFRRFWGKLYIAIDFIEVSGSELERFRIDKDSIWTLIGRKLQTRKLKKFLDIISEGELIENYVLDEEGRGECDICNSPELTVQEDGVNYCRTCEEFQKMGQVIPKITGFVMIPEKSFKGKSDTKYTMPFSEFYPFWNFKDLEGYPEGSKIFVKNGLNLEKIEREVHIESLLEKNCTFIPFYICDYAARDEEGGVKEFDDLAKSATGAKKLAVLRMDVDDLGKIFSMGLEGEETVSRMATLSRFLSHFFKNVLRLLSQGEISGDAPRIKQRDSREKEAVVVYSGGDDLFIVGAWDHIFELAFEIEDVFSEYVGKNPNITISAGYGIFDPKFPLYRMAEITGRREERAKEDGEKIAEKNGIEIKEKNRIYLSERLVGQAKKENGVKFKESYTWDEFRRIWNEYIPRIYNDTRPELKVPKGVIRRILDARREYLKNPKGFKWSVLLIYYLSRAKYNGKRLIDELEGLATRDAEKLRKNEPQDIYYIDVPLKFVDFAVRGGGD